MGERRPLREERDQQMMIAAAAAAAAATVFCRRAGAGAVRFVPAAALRFGGVSSTSGQDTGRDSCSWLLGFLLQIAKAFLIFLLPAFARSANILHSTVAVCSNGANCSLAIECYRWLRVGC